MDIPCFGVLSVSWLLNYPVCKEQAGLPSTGSTLLVENTTAAPRAQMCVVSYVFNIWCTVQQFFPQEPKFSVGFVDRVRVRVGVKVVCEMFAEDFMECWGCQLKVVQCGALCVMW